MNLYEYLKENNNLLAEARYIKQEEFFRHFQKEMEKKYDIKTIEIYSTGIFPRQKNIEGRRYFLSDNHFWNFFEHYLTAYFLRIRRLPYPIHYANLRSMIENMILLALANLHDNHPHLALSFAQEYQKCGMRMGDYERSFLNTGRVPDIDRIVFFSYVTVFIHEIAHKRFNSGDASEEAYQKFMEMLRSFTKEVKFLDRDKEDALHGIKQLLEKDDKKALEELYCDFSSLLSVMDLIIKKLGDTFSVEGCVTLTMESLLLPNIFRILLLQNKMFWEQEYYCFKDMTAHAEKNMEKIKNTFSETVSRISFITMLAQAYFVDRYHVPADAVNLTKVSDFDDISIGLLQPSRSREILKRAAENEEKYSLKEAREMRNKILKWKQDI